MFSSNFPDSLGKTCIAILLVGVVNHILKHGITSHQCHTFSCPRHSRIQQIPVIQLSGSLQKRNHNRRILTPLRFVYGNSVGKFQLIQKLIRILYLLFLIIFHCYRFLICIDFANNSHVAVKNSQSFVYGHSISG